MALDTQLSRKPYFDDYDVTKNFYRVLYRPSVAVQARELNQMQSILQDQIDKFGRHIFKEGSVIEGCGFTFDNSYNYVKIEDNYANNSAISNIEDFLGYTAINTNGLKARIVNVLPGYEAENPNLNTLYIKYLNSSTYANGAQQSVFANNETVSIQTDNLVNIGDVVVATVANSTGKGYAFTTTEGVIFKKGFFIRVEPQTFLISRYDNVPDDISVGFEAVEEIITPEIDTSLLDNAAGSPNEDAPGAHRLKIAAKIITKQTSTIEESSPFLSLCDFKVGLPVSIKNDPQYAVLAKDLARRTYETNGDYVVNPFLVTTEKKYVNTSVSNTTHLSVVASPGIGYVKGHRVEFINNNTANLRKGLDYATVTNQLVTLNFGYYFKVNQFCGDFNNDSIQQIELHNVAKTAITGKTFLEVSHSLDTKIGTAYVRGVSYYSGTPGVDATYLVYVFNISMLAGQKIDNVRSIIHHNVTVKAVADIIRDKDFSNTSIAKIQDSSNELMIYPFGQKAIKPDGFSSTGKYVYRNRAISSFTSASTGSLSSTISAAIGAGSEVLNYGVGSLSTENKQSIVIIPTDTGLSTNKAGTVAISTSTTTVTGTGTTFLSNYRVGDYIKVQNQLEVKLITQIANNTSMTVDSAFGSTTSGLTHQKTWPAGVPIDFSPPERTIALSNTTHLTASLGEALSADFSASVYFDIYRTNTVPVLKTVNKTTYVKIQANTNSGGTSGPWCLGLPDVYKLNAVYVDPTGGTYANTNPDKIDNFRLDTGQRDSYYGLAQLISVAPLPPNATILVSVDNFVADTSQGRGFFTAASYPIDDSNLANIAAIQTHQIPRYTTTLGNTVDLRDCVDFRPYVMNTAVSSSTIGNASVNPSNTTTFYIYGSDGSYIPTPGKNYESTIQYYLPRKDRIALTKEGSILVTEGSPNINPVAPPEVPGTMSLGVATVSPYPSLSPTEAREFNRYDYSIETNVLQTKRYTMADINKITTRIDRLEYYTALSLLEQATNSLLVRSDATGQNRFKNGIFVEPFKNHSIGNTIDSAYRIAIDEKKTEARPLFNQLTTSVLFDANTSSAVRKGDLIMLPHDHTEIQRQPYASKYRNCIEGNIYNYRGKVTLFPPGLVDPDITQNPVINSNIDLSSNWTSLSNSLNNMVGTQYGNWTNRNVPPTVTGASSSTSTSQSGNIETTTTTVTQNLSQQQQQISRSFSTTPPSDTTVEIGNYVTNVSVQTFVPSRMVYFSAVGMRPNTRLHVYLEGISLDKYLLPLTPYSGAIVTVGGINYTSAGITGNIVYTAHDSSKFEHQNNGWGGVLTTDSSGKCYGVINIPAATFKSGDLEFKLTDIDDLTTGESSVTTQAIQSLFCSSLSIQKNKANLNIRSSSIAVSEEINTRSIQQTSVQTTSTSIVVPDPIVIPNPYDAVYIEGGNFGGFDGFSGDYSGGIE